MTFIILIICVLLFIFHDWLGLSILTTIFINASMLSILFSWIDITIVKESKKKMENMKIISAKVVSKEVVHGYRGKTTYTFELKIENKAIQLSKDYVPRELEIDQLIDVLPIYDKQNNVVDFDLVEMVKLKSKIFIPIIVIALCSTLLSILFIVIDKTNFMTVSSNIIFSVLMLLLFVPVGIMCIKRTLINKNNLIAVKGSIHSVRQFTQYINGNPIVSYSPIYRVEIDGQIHQFLGEKFIKEEDVGKEVVVYYDKNTMEFFDQPKSNFNLILGVVMIVFCISILYNLLTSLN